MIFFENAGEDLDRRLELLGDDVPGPEREEVVDLRGVAGPDDDEDVRIELPDGLDASPGHRRIGNGEDDALGLTHAGLLEDGPAGDVAEDDGLALGGRGPERVRIELEDDIADPGLLEHVGEVLAVEAVSGDDDVVLGRSRSGFAAGGGDSLSPLERAFAPARPGPERVWMRIGVARMVRMDEAMKAWKMSSARSPLARPTPARTKENSPIWARARPVIRAIRGPYPRTATVRTTMRALRTRMDPTRPRTVNLNLQTAPVSRSMPTEMKNRLLKTSLNGRMSETTWWL